MEQLSLAAKKKRTKRNVFLAEMAAVVPWSMLEGLICGLEFGRDAIPDETPTCVRSVKDGARRPHD
jgi:hypothetical protein